MIDIKKQPSDGPITLIRAATCFELTEYEKKKLEKIEERAQQNKLEAIRVDGIKMPIDRETKTALIDLDLQSLAHKDKIDSNDINPDSVFFIKCEL